jgi:hypothetical protein
MCVPITLGDETESQYCSFTTFFFFLGGVICIFYSIVHTLIVIGVNSCSTDPNNKIGLGTNWPVSVHRYSEHKI